MLIRRQRVTLLLPLGRTLAIAPPCRSSGCHRTPPWGGAWGQLWIGLTDRAENRVFRWQNGTLATFLNWGGGEPNNFREREDCADMDRNQGYRWRDVSCGRTRDEFICRTR